MSLQKRRFLFLCFLIPLLGFVLSCAGTRMRTERVGDIETVTAQKGSKDIFKLVYTYAGDRKVMGEFWEAKEKDAKKTETTNIISKNFPSVFKHFQATMAGKEVADTSGVKLGDEKDGFILKFVKKVQYNAQGLPEKEMSRGISTIPVLGSFNISVDRMYNYLNNRLIMITERNNTVDSLILNLGIGNITTIQRDFTGRPAKVIKAIGSVPPTVEWTTYEYFGDSPNLSKTVYKQAGIDFKKLQIVPEKTITVYYSPGVPWEGKAIYSFTRAVAGLSIYNEIDKKSDIDISNFSKMNWVDKAKTAIKIGQLIKNEMKGPKWRMGELPDVPEPFLIQGDQTWW